MKCFCFLGVKDKINTDNISFSQDEALVALQVQQLCEEGLYGSTRFFRSFDDYVYPPDRVEKPGCWILWDKEVVGVLIARVIFEEAEVIHVVVSSKFRGKGNGYLLFENFEKALKTLDIKKIFLEVGRENISAQSLYKKIGFTNVAVRKKYYRGEEDAFIMEKQL